MSTLPASCLPPVSLSDQWDPLEELDEALGTVMRDLAIARIEVLLSGPARPNPHAAVSRVLADTAEGLRTAGFSDAVIKEHLAHAFDSVGIDRLRGMNP